MGKPITREKVEVPRRTTSRLRQRHSGPDPPAAFPDPITSPAQDTETANQNKTQSKDSALTLPLRPHTQQLKGHDPDDLSACSDLESGVADLSSRSSSGGDDGKDVDLE